MALRKLNLLEWLLVSGSLLILVPNSLWAQNQITGSIEGRVELEDGKPAPNAKILIKDEYRNVEVTVFSDAEGRYFRPLLQPGYYTLTCELEGYEISSERHVKINVASAGKLGVPPFRLTKVMTTP